MIDFDKLRKPDGSLDVEAYGAATAADRADRTAKGELCQERGCGRFIIWAKGYPQTCAPCKALDEPGALDHPGEIRCPKCGAHWSPSDSEDYDVYNDGDHEVTCSGCGHDFEIQTSVTYSFRSPERTKEAGESGSES